MTNYGRVAETRSTVQAMPEWEVVLPLWQAFLGNGPQRVHFVQLELASWDQVAWAKPRLRRISCPRLIVWGVSHRGKPLFTYASERAINIGYAASTLRAYWGRANRTAGLEDQKNFKVKRWSVDSAEKALVTVLEQVGFCRAYARDLIHSHKDLFKFVEVTHGGQAVVSRSRKSLPWPSRAELRKAKQTGREEQDDLHSDEKQTIFRPRRGTTKP